MAGSLKIRELLTRWAFKADTKKVDEFNKGIASAKALTKAAGRSLRGMARGANWVARRLVVVGGAIAGAGALAVKAAADAEESESKFAAVFGKNAANLTKWSDDYAKAAQRNRFELREQASTFGALFDAMEFTGDQTANLSKRLTQLTVDVASFHDEAESDVLIALRSGLLGNVEPVIKYGANVQVARVNQELLNMGIRGGVKAANDQQKMLARLNIILRATSKGHGDAVKTSGSFKNRMRGLKAEIKDFLIVAGTPLLKMLAPVVKKITDAVRGTKEWVVANKVLIRQGLDAYIKKVADFLKSIDWKRIWQGIKGVASALLGVLKVLNRLIPRGKEAQALFIALFGAAMIASIAKTAAAVKGVFAAFGLVGAAAGGVLSLFAALLLLTGYIVANWDEIKEMWSYFPMLWKDIVWNIQESFDRFRRNIAITVAYMKQELGPWLDVLTGGAHGMGNAQIKRIQQIQADLAAAAPGRGAGPRGATTNNTAQNLTGNITVQVMGNASKSDALAIGQETARQVRNFYRETMPDIVR